MNAAIQRERHGKILALVAAPRDRHALLTKLRKGTRGRHDKEQKGKQERLHSTFYHLHHAGQA